LVSRVLANIEKAQFGKNEQLALEKGLVSIIIPTYNYGRYIRASIESALKQTYRHIEVIVVDVASGSTDDTAAIVSQYPVKYVFQSNRGKSDAMNTGVRLSRGEFFMALDADDVMSEQYVEKTLVLMLTNRKIGLVYAGGRFFGEREDAIPPRKLYHRFSVLIGARAIGGELGCIGAALTRRTAFESVGGYDPTLVAYEDLDLVLRIRLKGWEIKPVFEFLFSARKHDSEVAHRHPEVDTLKDRYVRGMLDRKFWFLSLYRKLFLVYRVLFEKLFFMIQIPKACLTTISKKYRILHFAKWYPWHIAANRKNGIVLAEVIATEANWLLSARVAREPFLINYHLDQIAKRESDLVDLVMKDAGFNPQNFKRKLKISS
jgi:glycosyltransferase involved in cell wall biosynthesis